MINMCRHTGKAISGEESVVQSVNDILTTPKGSRVMLREYGSDLYKLVGSNADAQDIRYEVADAIDKWEPRFVFKNVRLSQEKGVLSIVIIGVYKPRNKTIKIRVKLNE